MDIRPIRSEADYEAALAETDRLMSAEPGYHPPHAPREPWPVAPRPGAGDRLARPRRGGAKPQRALTLPMIRRLHAQLGIPLEALVREYQVEAA